MVKPERSQMPIACAKMTASRCEDAYRLLNAFLREDRHYLASSAAYGDKGTRALKRAIATFLKRPELGFVWLAYSNHKAVGVCVVSYAISTSIGGIVAKLDDVFVDEGWQNHGIATQMLLALQARLKSKGIRRIDTSVYKKNRTADKFYQNLGFEPLGEERLALVL
jgi:GNAT superfamily N-acetyltransferase